MFNLDWNRVLLSRDVKFNEHETGFKKKFDTADSLNDPFVKLDVERNCDSQMETSNDSQVETSNDSQVETSNNPEVETSNGSQVEPSYDPQIEQSCDSYVEPNSESSEEANDLRLRRSGRCRSRPAYYSEGVLVSFNNAEPSSYKEAIACS